MKTRLTAAISAEEAAEFHSLCLRDAWNMLGQIGEVDRFFYCDIADRELEMLVGAEKFNLQEGADLGAKMLRCLDELLGRGYRDALIVGSDSPTLPVACIDDSVRALEGADVVLGPSEDGGYYLIGARQTHPAMFKGVTWSDERTRTQTVSACEAAGLRVAEVGRWYDVDQPADLERLGHDPAISPRLREWLGNVRRSPTMKGAQR